MGNLIYNSSIIVLSNYKVVGISTMLCVVTNLQNVSIHTKYSDVFILKNKNEKKLSFSFWIMYVKNIYKL